MSPPAIASFVVEVAESLGAHDAKRARLSPESGASSGASRVSAIAPTRERHTVHLTRYQDVKNVDALQRLLAVDGTWHGVYAVVDGSKLLSTFQLRLACFLAVQRWYRGTQRTRSLTAEIVYALSPSTNITQSLRTYGLPQDVAESSTGYDDLYFIRIDGDAAAMAQELGNAVDGRPAMSLDLNAAAVDTASRTPTTRLTANESLALIAMAVKGV